MSTVKNGTVKFFNKVKAFGFIIDKETDEEVFVHITGVNKGSEDLTENDKVTFETQDGKKGLTAVNVELV